jgi:hypothetical protein
VVRRANPRIAAPGRGREARGRRPGRCGSPLRIVRRQLGSAKSRRGFFRRFMRSRDPRAAGIPMTSAARSTRLAALGLVERGAAERVTRVDFRRQRVRAGTRHLSSRLARTSGVSMRCSLTNHICCSLLRATPLSSKSAVPSSPSSVAANPVSPVWASGREVVRRRERRALRVSGLAMAHGR